MKPHKWAKEIKAWADGEKVYGRMDTHKSIIAEFEVNQLSQFDVDSHSFYLKPQPKEPQYLYAYERIDNGNIQFSPRLQQTGSAFEYIGKIKLEVDDD